MDKALNMAKVSASGGLKLFIGRIASTVITALGTILLTILISEGDYGIYAVALIPATTVLLFQDWGVGSAMTKYSATYRSLNKEGELRRIIAAGFTFEAMTGLILTAFSLLTAGFVASSVFGKPETALIIVIASISVFFLSH